MATDGNTEVEKIVFEEEEKLPAVVLEDCFLQSFLHPPQPQPRHPPKLVTDAQFFFHFPSHDLVVITRYQVDTTIDTVDRAVGPAKMMVNAGTSYEYQSLTVGQAQRAIANSRLIAFLKEALPIMEHELEECRLFRKILN